MSKGYRHRPSLVHQAAYRLEKKSQIGESRFLAKKGGEAQAGIYSRSTMRNYVAINARALKQIQRTHPDQHIRSLDEAQAYVPEFLTAKREEGCSASTLKTYRSALTKLYGVEDWGVELPKRDSCYFSRSRGPKLRDANFSEEKNEELIAFCRATGLRRAELEGIRGTDLVCRDGRYYVSVTRNLGKGGRDRQSLIVGTTTEIERVIDRFAAAGNKKVWGKVHTAADIHAYRSDYAWRLYKFFSRDTQALAREERYDGRGADAGRKFDKMTLQIISLNLGHSQDTPDVRRQRLGVVVKNYLYLRPEGDPLKDEVYAKMTIKNGL